MITPNLLAYQRSLYLLLYEYIVIAIILLRISNIGTRTLVEYTLLYTHTESRQRTSITGNPARLRQIVISLASVLYTYYTINIIEAFINNKTSRPSKTKKVGLTHKHEHEK